ncbi:MAG: hypothetical protein P9L90_03645 [Candidatus Aadella gelida]|nr:hypothetical protein [Candidatus Aadella gelida]
MISRICSSFLVIMVGIVLCAGGMFAQETSPVSEGQASARISRDEMMKRIKGVFQHRLDVLALMTDIEQEKSSAGVIYKYKGVNIDDLDDEALFGLLKVVNSQLSLRNMQKLQKQMDDIKKIEEINKKR